MTDFYLLNVIIKIKAGYVSGERIEFVVQISNKSYRKIYPLKIFLVEKMTYLSRKIKHFCLINTKCFLTNNTCIEPLQNYEWNDTSSSLFLPSLCHSSNGSCKIMIREYFLRLKVSPSESKHFYLKIPIIIGNLIKLNL